MDNLSTSMKKYMCMDTVVHAGLIYILLRFVPGPRAIANMLPIPGGSSGVSVGEVLVASIIASIVSKPLTKNMCAM
jgi:hypothetical protein